MVKSELGLDAVILHTKRYRKGGFLGYKGKEMVEVTAAVEELPKSSLKAAKPKFKAETVPEPDMLVPKKVLTLYKTAGTVQAATEVEPQQEQLQKSQNRRSIKADDQMMQIPDSMQSPQEKKIQQLQQELNQMKIMLEKVMVDKPTGTATVSLQQALAEQEVDEAIIQDIVSSAEDPAVLFDKQTPEAVAHLQEYLERTLALSTEGIEIGPQENKIVALVGATGVGKTTTVAKIAAKFVLEKGMSAALITADTYRISAVEQLKTYSDIIGLPLEIVYSPAELKAAIDKHSDKQLILIDTAGRSQHNEFQINELRDFLAVDHSIEKHLVLSATTKYKDAVDIIRKFSLCVPDKVLFTKTDETSSVGLILNIAQQYALHLSYLTNGQSVPDDIFPARSKSLAEMLLR